MGQLDRAVGYLSGAMENVKDSGVQWRKELVSLSMQAELNIDYIDPTNKPGGRNIKIGEEKEYQKDLQRTGQFKKLQKYVHRYRRIDLRFTDISDFIIVFINPDIPQYGTSNEIYVSESQHKPSLFICKGGLYKFPRWLFDVCDIDDFNNALNVFESVEEVIDQLIKLDQGQEPLSGEWVLVRKHIEEHRDIRLDLENQLRR